MDIAESLKVLSKSDVRSVLGKTEVKKELDFYRYCFTRVTNTLPLVKEKVTKSPRPLTLIAGGLLRESLRIAEQGNTAIAVNANGYDLYRSYSDDLQEKERAMADRYLDSGRILLVEGDIFESDEIFGTKVFDEVYATGMWEEFLLRREILATDPEILFSKMLDSLSKITKQDGTIHIVDDNVSAIENLLTQKGYKFSKIELLRNDPKRKSEYERENKTYYEFVITVMNLPMHDTINPVPIPKKEEEEKQILLQLQRAQRDSSPHFRLTHEIVKFEDLALTTDEIKVMRNAPGGTNIFHLQRLLEKGRSIEEKQFALACVQYASPIEEGLDDAEASRRMRISTDTINGDGPDTCMWWTLSPYIYDQLHAKIGDRQAIESLITWAESCGSKQKRDNNRVHLPGLWFYNNIAVGSEYSPVFILSPDPTGFSHVFARSEATRLISKGFIK